MEITAQAKYIRVSPRKMELLAKSIRALRPEEAVTKLEFINKSGALALKKVIVSALANAKKNADFTNKARFKTIEVLSGSGMKRFLAVSRGMAHEYKKRMSHVKVVLTDEVLKNSKSQIPNTKQISFTKILK